MDPVLKYCAVGRQLGYATYLTLDTITYVGLLRSLEVYPEIDAFGCSMLLVSDRLPALKDCNMRHTRRGLLA